MAFSGGLDTSVCVSYWKRSMTWRVITACVDVGQPEDEIERLEWLQTR